MLLHSRDICLSICMPTYNFGKFIGESLESILKQMPEGVEIVVLDGGSTDNTYDVVKSIQQHCPMLSYHRQSHRGGIDRDMARTVELARGKYCWLFSSDDLMHQGALRRVLEEIDLGFDLYLCGLTLCTREMQPLMQHPVLRLGSDAVFDLGNERDRIRYFELAETTTAFFSFMGSLIVKKSRWDAISFDESFDGSLWAHVARVFRMIPQGLTVKYLQESLLDKRGDNDSFMDKGLVHRYMMAVDGYHRLADTFFGKHTAENRHIRRVVRNEFPALRTLVSLKVKVYQEENHAEQKLLDELAAKMYKDSSLISRFPLLLYKSVPAPALKVAKTFYKAMKPYLSRN
jgi:abequosyltransferase